VTSNTTCLTQNGLLSEDIIINPTRYYGLAMCWREQLQFIKIIMPDNGTKYSIPPGTDLVETKELIGAMNQIAQEQCGFVGPEIVRSIRTELISQIPIEPKMWHPLQAWNELRLSEENEPEAKVLVVHDSDRTTVIYYETRVYKASDLSACIIVRD
jgi:hypothetical protein